MFPALLSVVLCAGVSAETTHTLYYVFANPDNYTVKANGCMSNGENAWCQTAMTKSAKTYKGTPVYAGTMNEKYGGLDKLQFQQYDGSTWKAQVVAFEAWTTTGVWSGKMYTGSAWVDYAYDVTITYNANGGSGSASSTSGLNSDNLTIASGDGLANEGYSFAGWNTAADGTGDDYYAGAAVQIDDDLTLFAQWVKDDVGEYTVQVTDDGNGTTSPSGAVIIKKDESVVITATANAGYIFKEWQTAGGVLVEDATNATTTITATAAGSVTATFVPVIYFKNTLDWSDVYVYTFSAAVWVADKGVTPKTNRLEFGEMTQLGNTDVYYFALSDNSFAYVAFSDKDMSGYDEFYKNNAVYRGDRTDKMNMFIPERGQTPAKTNSTSYSSTGIWMIYNSTESGYDVRGGFNDWEASNPLVSASAGGFTYETTIALEQQNYDLKIYNVNGANFANGKAITFDNCADIQLNVNGNNTTITPSAPGNYRFIASFGDGKVMLSVEYPVAQGYYRLVYTEGAEPQYTNYHPSHSVRQRATGTVLDTISFHINPANTPAILLQQCSDITSAGTEWTTIGTYPVADISAISATGIYNLVLKQSGGTATLQTDATHLYTGEYYIRTDVAEGGWDDYRVRSNRMTYSDYAKQESGFDYYFCHWTLKGTNVKFTIANKYSECLSDSLNEGEYIGTDGLLPANANVRFAWNSETNTLSRAYIDGAQQTGSEFLLLHGNTDTDAPHIYKVSSDTPEDKILFADKGDWVYQIDIKADTKAHVKLTAKYQNATQYFKGAAGDWNDGTSEQIIGGNSSGQYTLRVVYDFKTNHLVTAWLPGGEISEDATINADMMILRSHQEQASQITFSGDYSLQNIQTVYGVMLFDKATLNDASLSVYERSLYWISFPFDVQLNEVFGFGEYGKHWIIEYYDSDKRAEKGFWIDSESNWTFVTDKSDFTLKANMGYVLALDLDQLTASSSVFKNTDQVTLYFPSSKEVNIVRQATVNVELPEHKCLIERNHRNIYDSDWNLMGVPSFADETRNDPRETPDEYPTYAPSNAEIGFYYAWDPTTNELSVEKADAHSFRAMNAYLVQYAGTLQWTVQAGVQQSLAPQRHSDYSPKTYTLRLSLQSGGKEADKTFIQLCDEGATTGFDTNLDLTKAVNAGSANIYSLIDTMHIEAAANSLPVSDETIVPLGVRIATDDDYTFALPDGTEGITATLIDYDNNVETNLLLSDYTTHIPAGKHNTRFALRLNGKRVTTAIDTVHSADNSTHKYLIDGQLYIRQDGHLFDATGRLVR